MNEEQPHSVPQDPGAIGQVSHPHCVVCGRDNEQGLGMTFTLLHDGSVESEICCGAEFEGYPNQLHGGVVAMLLDGAMTNCLFAHRREAVTAELTVRYRHPVHAGRTAWVRAWIEHSRPPFTAIAASLVQDGHIRVTARAKFLDRD